MHRRALISFARRRNNFGKETPGKLLVCASVVLRREEAICLGSFKRMAGNFGRFHEQRTLKEVGVSAWRWRGNIAIILRGEQRRSRNKQLFGTCSKNEIAPYEGTPISPDPAFVSPDASPDYNLFLYLESTTLALAALDASRFPLNDTNRDRSNCSLKILWREETWRGLYAAYATLHIQFESGERRGGA